jgi:hypothetical protein
LAKNPQPLGRYPALIDRIFFGANFGAYDGSQTELKFDRVDIEKAAEELGVKLPKNIGDVIYSIRYRSGMPASILATQPPGMEWIIEGVGRAQYSIRLVPFNRIVPNANLMVVKIPDGTPEIIRSYALNDEQALLAIVRYNRLIDIFLGVTAFSLQNHLRTTLVSGTQIEIDEIYVGLDRKGAHYVIPVQAKGGTDQLSVVQTKQDLACCAEKFPGLECRTVSAQFMADDVVAMFELAVEADMVVIVDEKHYRLVPADQITADDLAIYRRS